MGLTPEPARIIDVEPDRQREWADVATSVFLAPRITDDEFAYRSPRYQGQRLRAAVDDDRIVATFRSFDTFLTVPGGGAIAANAVSSVTVLPTHRRRGLLTQLMRADLAAADERGAPVSILIPSEAPIYGRFGFGPAAHTAAWQVDARAAVFRHGVPGRLEVLRYEELRPYAPGIYDAARRRQPGAIDRSDIWWNMFCAVPPPPDGPDRSLRAVLYRDDDGRPQGYATYRTDDAWGLSKSEVTLTVQELVAATDDAYQALWQFCCQVDLVATVAAKDRSVAEPLPWLLRNHRVAHQTSRTEFLWVRVHDPRTALAARRYASAGRLVLEVVDDGPAAGRYLLDVDGEGTATCQSTQEAPDLTMPLATLGAVYLGGNSLGTLAKAGWLDEHRAGAGAAAEATLRTPDVPWCGTWF